MLYLGIAPLCIADLARANGSLFSGTRTFVRASYSEPVARTPSTAMRTAKRDIIATKASVGSLFLDKPATGLFAPHSPSVSSRHAHAPRAQLVRLRRLIEMAESRRDGYDAVQFGAKIKPAKKPTRMTLGEIDVWTRATPGQPHAIGRYQFIPPTLRRLVKHLGLTPGTRFSEAIQDQLADVLLAEAGLESFQSGEMERETFMINLAKIWAGLPTPNGRSYYHGHAGNKASVSWELFDSEMARIFPDTAPTRVASR
ncbi:hypothetical protein C8N43_2896 [Litoreibacter ponti]|uniref:Muramidase (Phage lysozyme) n=2 Tax=Litoreibacter ponti TaxID=1510457 RepID=A0A2T6BDF1_9RHOB|nr:hypothetical protein C8N43_2896 [Litoreibacter ponti]